MAAGANSTAASRVCVCVSVSVCARGGAAGGCWFVCVQ